METGRTNRETLLGTASGFLTESGGRTLLDG